MMIPDLTPIERYLRDTGRTPFFLFVGGDGYATARGELLSMGLSPLPLSTLCPATDRLPLADDVVAAVRARTAAGEYIVVTGLAEYLALRGATEAERLMRRLKDLSCGLGAAVLLLRNFFAWAGVVTSDPRMVAGERRAALRRTAADDGALLPGQMMELMVVAPELPAEGALCGMQNVLRAWEGGARRYTDGAEPTGVARGTHPRAAGAQCIRSPSAARFNADCAGGLRDTRGVGASLEGAGGTAGYVRAP